jgi:hypothetical protein
MDEIRYLIVFIDGGAGMRTRSGPLEVGDAIDDCGETYSVVRVEQPPSEAGFGRAWAERDTAEGATSRDATRAAG